MRKIAHYFYSDGNEIQVFASKRKYYYRDGNGEIPVCPGRRIRYPHPDEGIEATDSSYEALGLYYGYEMRDTGWSGDC